VVSIGPEPFFLIPFGLFAVGLFILWIWALIDALSVRDDSMYRTGSKLVWVLVIVFLHAIGALLYLAIGRPIRGTSSPERPVPPIPPPPPPV
jgi:Phospholipase_D-nuclease N-terminal